jgi:hypothetical protein
MQAWGEDRLVPRDLPKNLLEFQQMFRDAPGSGPKQASGRERRPPW